MEAPRTEALGDAPGPPPRRGLLDDARFYARMLADPIAVVGERFARYGDLYRVPPARGGPPLFVLRHPDHFREVLLTDADSYRKQHSAFELLSRVLGDGLLTSDGEAWKRQRRLVQPAFSRARLADYAATMTDEAARTTGSWRAGDRLDANRAMMELTLRVVCRTLFSHDVTAETDDVARAMAVLQELAVGVSQRLPEWLPTPQRARFRRAVGAIDRVVLGMVRARRDAVGAGAAAPADLLQSLVTAVDEEGAGGGGAGDRLAEREVRDQLVTLFLAGHETTSHALTWALYLLARNPDAERKVRDELTNALGGRAARYEDLERLPYTEQVLKESLRMYPPAYLLARGARRDTTLGGHPVPAGSEVVLWVYFTQRDPRWFPEPEAFRPERFEPDAEARLPKLAYAPFGAGARACVGKVFAMVEGVLLLATLLQRFRFELAPGAPPAVPRPRVTLGPRRAVEMTLRRA